MAADCLGCGLDKAVIVSGSLGKVLSAQFCVGGERFTLTGRSWAADGTAFCVPEWSVGFDAGHVVHNKSLDTVLVTHTHTDHAHHLTHLKSRHKPPTFCVPHSCIPMVQNFLGDQKNEQREMRLRDRRYLYRELPAIVILQNQPITNNIIQLAKINFIKLTKTRYLPFPSMSMLPPTVI